MENKNKSLYTWNNEDKNRMGRITLLGNEKIEEKTINSIKFCYVNGNSGKKVEGYYRNFPSLNHDFIHSSNNLQGKKDSTISTSTNENINSLSDNSFHIMSSSSSSNIYKSPSSKLIVNNSQNTNNSYKSFYNYNKSPSRKTTSSSNSNNNVKIDNNPVNKIQDPQGPMDTDPSKRRNKNNYTFYVSNGPNPKNDEKKLEISKAKIIEPNINISNIKIIEPIMNISNVQNTRPIINIISSQKSQKLIDISNIKRAEQDTEIHGFKKYNSGNLQVDLNLLHPFEAKTFKSPVKKHSIESDYDLSNETKRKNRRRFSRSWQRANEEKIIRKIIDNKTNCGFLEVKDVNQTPKKMSSNNSITKNLFLEENNKETEKTCTERKVIFYKSNSGSCETEINIGRNKRGLDLDNKNLFEKYKNRIPVAKPNVISNINKKVVKKDITFKEPQNSQSIFDAKKVFVFGPNGVINRGIETNTKNNNYNTQYYKLSNSNIEVKRVNENNINLTQTPNQSDIQSQFQRKTKLIHISPKKIEVENHYNYNNQSDGFNKDKILFKDKYNNNKGNNANYSTNKAITKENKYNYSTEISFNVSKPIKENKVITAVNIYIPSKKKIKIIKIMPENVNSLSVNPIDKNVNMSIERPIRFNNVSNTIGIKKIGYKNLSCGKAKKREAAIENGVYSREGIKEENNYKREKYYQPNTLANIKKRNEGRNDYLKEKGNESYKFVEYSNRTEIYKKNNYFMKDINYNRNIPEDKSDNRRSYWEDVTHNKTQIIRDEYFDGKNKKKIENSDYRHINTSGNEGIEKHNNFEDIFNKDKLNNENFLQKNNFIEDKSKNIIINRQDYENHKNIENKDKYQYSHYKNDFFVSDKERNTCPIYINDNYGDFYNGNNFFVDTYNLEERHTTDINNYDKKNYMDNLYSNDNKTNSYQKNINYKDNYPKNNNYEENDFNKEDFRKIDFSDKNCPHNNYSKKNEKKDYMNEKYIKENKKENYLNDYYKDNNYSKDNYMDNNYTKRNYTDNNYSKGNYLDNNNLKNDFPNNNFSKENYTSENYSNNKNVNYQNYNFKNENYIKNYKIDKEEDARSKKLKVGKVEILSNDKTPKEQYKSETFLKKEFINYSGPNENYKTETIIDTKYIIKTEKYQKEENKKEDGLEDIYKKDSYQKDDYKEQSFKSYQNEINKNEDITKNFYKNETFQNEENKNDYSQNNSSKNETKSTDLNPQDNNIIESNKVEIVSKDSKESDIFENELKDSNLSLSNSIEVIRNLNPSKDSCSYTKEESEPKDNIIIENELKANIQYETYPDGKYKNDNNSLDINRVENYSKDIYNNSKETNKNESYQNILYKNDDNLEIINKIENYSNNLYKNNENNLKDNYKNDKYQKDIYKAENKFKNIYKNVDYQNDIFFKNKYKDEKNNIKDENKNENTQKDNYELNNYNNDKDKNNNFKKVNNYKVEDYKETNFNSEKNQKSEIISENNSKEDFNNQKYSNYDFQNRKDIYSKDNDIRDIIDEGKFPNDNLNESQKEENNLEKKQNENAMKNTEKKDELDKEEILSENKINNEGKREIEEEEEKVKEEEKEEKEKEKEEEKAEEKEKEKEEKEKEKEEEKEKEKEKEEEKEEEKEKENEEKEGEKENKEKEKEKEEENKEKENVNLSKEQNDGNNNISINRINNNITNNNITNNNINNNINNQFEQNQQNVINIDNHTFQRVTVKKVKRKRPVYRIPPNKRKSVSQGKSLTFIHKYYDESFILEEDNEDEEERKPSPELVEANLNPLTCTEINLKREDPFSSEEKDEKSETEMNNKTDSDEGREPNEQQSNILIQERNEGTLDIKNNKGENINIPENIIIREKEEKEEKEGKEEKEEEEKKEDKKEENEENEKKENKNYFKVIEEAIWAGPLIIRLPRSRSQCFYFSNYVLPVPEFDDDEKETKKPDFHNKENSLNFDI